MESVWEISDDLRRRAEMWRRYFRDEGWLMGWAERFVEGQTDSYAESLFLLLEERFGRVPWTLGSKSVTPGWRCLNAGSSSQLPRQIYTRSSPASSCGPSPASPTQAGHAPSWPPSSRSSYA